MQSPRARLLFDPLRAGIDMVEEFLRALERDATDVADAVSINRIHSLRAQLLSLRERVADAIETYSALRYEHRKHKPLQHARKAESPIPIARDERVTAAVGSVDDGG